MNIENMKLLHSQLSRLRPEQFDISVSIHYKSGEIVACVAGWAAILNDGPAREFGWDKIQPWAEEWLGLEDNNGLLVGYWPAVKSRSMESITLEETLTEMARLIAEEEA